MNKMLCMDTPDWQPGLFYDTFKPTLRIKCLFQEDPHNKTLDTHFMGLIQ